jgi:hypothetical protein
MSHFIVYVLGENVDDQLIPYDENIEVPKYNRGLITTKEWKQFRDYYLKDISKETDVTKKKLIDMEIAKDKKLTNAQLYKKHGEGWNNNNWEKKGNKWVEVSTYNPNSKWDWYEVGGRWENCLTLKNGEKTSEATIGEIDWNKTMIPFAFVINSNWYEKGQMGWWGMSINDKAEAKWKREFMKAIKDLPENTEITAVDMHI